MFLCLCHILQIRTFVSCFFCFLFFSFFAYLEDRGMTQKLLLSVYKVAKQEQDKIKKADYFLKALWRTE